MAQPSAADRDARPDRVVDLDAAIKLAKGRRDILARVAGVFLGDYPGVIEAIHASVTQQDYEAVRRSAHRLKGGLGIFAAGRARRAAFDLETAAGQRDRIEVEGSLRRLTAALDALRPALEKLHNEAVDGSAAPATASGRRAKQE